MCDIGHWVNSFEKKTRSAHKLKSSKLPTIKPISSHYPMMGSKLKSQKNLQLFNTKYPVGFEVK